MLPEDIIHVKFPNPGDPLEGLGYGLPPLSSVAYSVDVDNLATSFLNVFFQKGTMLAGVLSFDIPLKEDVVDTVLERWKKKYGGSGKWGEVGVLDRGAKYSRLGLTIEEMGFGQLDERNESRILSVFGVPPILVGSRLGIAGSTYSNAESARRMVWEDTLLPELKLFEVEYQRKLNHGQSFVKFDFSQVPALMKDIPILVNAAYTLTRMGVPPNQALQAVGLKIGDVPDGDKPLQQFSQTPVERGEGRGEEQGPRSDAEDDSWGMSSLDCSNCGGSLKMLVDSKNLVECRSCSQLYQLSNNGRVSHGELLSLR